jgi:hypothetical protein
MERVSFRHRGLTETPVSGDQLPLSEATVIVEPYYVLRSGGVPRSLIQVLDIPHDDKFVLILHCDPLVAIGAAERARRLRLNHE